MALSAGVTLREVTEIDIPLFFAMESDPVAHTMARFPPRARETFERHWTTLLQDEDVLARTILLDGEVAGNIVSWSFGRDRCVGYWIDRAFWGRGIATAALTLFLTIERTRSLYAQAAASNTGSRRVLEKCGFVLLHADELTFKDPAQGFTEVTYVLTAP
jgi:RimJ/RimL family protein N-acetyltransferase